VLRCDLYAIDIDQEKNCYNCRGFEYIARNCKNQRIVGQERRLKYRDNSNNGQSDLNEDESLIVLN